MKKWKYKPSVFSPIEEFWPGLYIYWMRTYISPKYHVLFFIILNTVSGYIKWMKKRIEM